MRQGPGPVRRRLPFPSIEVAQCRARQSGHGGRLSESLGAEPETVGQDEHRHCRRSLHEVVNAGVGSGHALKHGPDDLPVSSVMLVSNTLETYPVIGMRGRVRTDRQFAYAIMAQRHNVPSRATLTAVLIGTARYRSSLIVTCLLLMVVAECDGAVGEREGWQATEWVAFRPPGSLRSGVRLSATLEGRVQRGRADE